MFWCGMPDEVTAQKILQEWATTRGFATTLAEKRLYFHYDGFNGFAFLDFEKSPSIKLQVSTNPSQGANDSMRISFWSGVPDWSNPNPKPKHEYETYDLNLADEKVLSKIERVLERIIDSYTEGL